MNNVGEIFALVAMLLMCFLIGSVFVRMVVGMSGVGYSPPCSICGCKKTMDFKDCFGRASWECENCGVVLRARDR